jgi:hypothetical protein
MDFPSISITYVVTSLKNTIIECLKSLGKGYGLEEGYTLCSPRSSKRKLILFYLIVSN